MTTRTRIHKISAGYSQALMAAGIEAQILVSELAAPARTRTQRLKRLKRLLMLSPALAGVGVSVASFGLAACGADVKNGGSSQIVDLANNVAWFLIAVGLAVSLASFAYAGFLFATAGGNWHTMYTHDGGGSSDRAAKGMKLAKNVLIGMGILVSGAVVKAILITVVTSTGKSVVGGNSGAVGATNNAVDCSGQLDTRFNTGG